MSWSSSLKKRPADRGLPGTDLARQLDESFAFSNAIEKIVQSFPVLFAEEQVFWIRRYIERRFLESVIVVVQSVLMLRGSPANTEVDVINRFTIRRFPVLIPLLRLQVIYCKIG